MWVGTTYLSAGHIESEAAGWKSGRLHCSLPRSDKSSSRSRLCWLRNNIYFPSAALRGNIPSSNKNILLLKLWHQRKISSHLIQLLMMISKWGSSYSHVSSHSSEVRSVHSCSCKYFELKTRIQNLHFLDAATPELKVSIKQGQSCALSSFQESRSQCVLRYLSLICLMWISKKLRDLKKKQGHNVEELKFTKDATKYCLGMNY